MSKTNKISVCLAVYNEATMLRTCLNSVADFADEIVIVDGQSSDDTVKIAKEFKAKIISTTNKPNFHINKQMAIDACSGDLILQLDADEVVDRQLKDFILQIARDDNRGIAAWQLKRKNLFFRHFLRKGGQYPDMVIRLFWKNKAYLPQKDVHEQMVVEGELAIADGHLLHYANPDLATYLRKANTYTSFRAAQLAQEKVPINFAKWCEYLIAKPLATWFSIFCRHRGFVDGFAGFLFAYLSGLHHSVSWLKYVESLRPTVTGHPQVFFPVSQFAGLNAPRGVGRYAAWLIDNLEESGEIEIVDDSRRANVIHYTFFDLFFAGLKKWRGQKVVVTAHDVIPLLFPAEYKIGLRGRLNLFWQTKKLRHVDLVLTDSSASKNDLMKYLGINERKIEVVYLAGNPNLKPVDDDNVAKILRQYKLPKNYCLYVGDINYNKNLPQLIKAMKFLPKSLNLVLVGKNFRAQNINEWRAIDEQLNLSEVGERVHFVNNVDSDDDLAAIYTGALCYVQPSLAEGFGLPVLEAMQCGTPVICNDISVFHEIAGDAAIFTASNANAIAETIIQVNNLNDSERAKISRECLQQAKQFTWQKTTAQMISIYAKLATWQ